MIWQPCGSLTLQKHLVEFCWPLLENWPLVRMLLGDYHNKPQESADKGFVETFLVRRGEEESVSGREVTVYMQTHINIYTHTHKYTPGVRKPLFCPVDPSVVGVCI